MLKYDLSRDDMAAVIQTPGSTLDDWLSDHGLPAFRGRQIFSWLYRPGIPDFSEMTDLPERLADFPGQRGDYQPTGPGREGAVSRRHHQVRLSSAGWKND